jgi:hypothetical protein
MGKDDAWEVKMNLIVTGTVARTANDKELGWQPDWPFDATGHYLGYGKRRWCNLVFKFKCSVVVPAQNLSRTRGSGALLLREENLGTEALAEEAYDDHMTQATFPGLIQQYSYQIEY